MQPGARVLPERPERVPGVQFHGPRPIPGTRRASLMFENPAEKGNDQSRGTESHPRVYKENKAG